MNSTVFKLHKYDGSLCISEIDGYHSHMEMTADVRDMVEETLIKRYV